MHAIATHIVIPLSKMVKKFAFLVDFCPFLKKSHPSPKICSADVRKNFTFFNISFLGINRESKLMTTSLSGKTPRKKRFILIIMIFLLLPTNCLCLFDHFVGLALEGLIVLAEHMEFSKGTMK